MRIIIKKFTIIICALSIVGCSSDEAAESEIIDNAGTIERVDPRLDALVPTDANIQKLAGGFTNTTPFADAIAKALASSPITTRSATGVRTHEFQGRYEGRQCEFRVTSVLGHCFSLDFAEAYRDWDACDPAELWDAPVVSVPTSGGVLKNLRETASGGDALIPSNAKLAALGTPIDLPLGHKDEVWSFDHFDTMTVMVADAPRPDEIVLCMAVADGGRPNPRVGSGPITD